MKKLIIFGLIMTLTTLFFGNTFAQSFETAKPLSQVVNTSLKPVQMGSKIPVPLITWGGDILTIYGEMEGVFSSNGLNVELFCENDFKKQVQDVINGKTPYLRGTMGMVKEAAEAFQKAGTGLVVFYKLTWSVGGDALVVRSGKTPSNIKTVALQLYGPHMDYAANIFNKAGRLNTVSFKWTKELSYNDFGKSNPVESFIGDPSLDAAFCIIPDALALTSNGNVGTGADGSVKGAKIYVSTKSASRIIADVYAVREDYYNSHKSEVQKLTKALMMSEEKLSDLLKNKSAQQSKYEQLMSKSSGLLFGTTSMSEDAKAMIGDCEFAGFNGNFAFFTGKGTTRNFDKLNSEIQSSFAKMGLLTGNANLKQANWDYSSLKSGLKYATATTTTPVVKSQPKFDEKKVAQVIESKIKAESDTWETDNTLFVVEIYFKPNQQDFTVEEYKTQFAKALDIMETYAGAIVVIEGHSDRGGILKAKKSGASNQEIAQITQIAKNLSVERAKMVEEVFVKYAKTRGIVVDKTQMHATGRGVDSPKYPKPSTKDEWLENFRVVFRIKNLESESLEFDPSLYQ